MRGLLPEKVERLEEYLPNTEVFCVRLDANESPFTPSPALLDRFAAAVREISYNRYPDPQTKAMTKAYGRFIGVPAENLTAGNGSDELISLIFTAFLARGDKAVVCAPDFSMYAFYCGIAEAEAVRYNKPEGYKIDFDELAALVRSSCARLVIFSNPCNPTSVCYDRETILKFAASTGCLTVVDEAYMEFSRTDGSVIGYVNDYPNLMVLKTLSKLGLAALRAGFAAAGRELTSALRKVKSPYNVNSVTQALVTAALTDGFDAEFRAHIAEIKSGTEIFYNELSSDPRGYTLVRPDANFVSLRFERTSEAERVFKGLRERSIAVRFMKPALLRVTCGSPAENAEFLEEFRRILR